jgi:hypothetical protein
MTKRYQKSCRSFALKVPQKYTGRWRYSMLPNSESLPRGKKMKKIGPHETF